MLILLLLFFQHFLFCAYFFRQDRLKMILKQRTLRIMKIQMVVILPLILAWLVLFAKGSAPRRTTNCLNATSAV